MGYLLPSAQTQHEDFEGQLDMKDGYIITKGGFGTTQQVQVAEGYLPRAMCKTSHIDKPLPVQRVAVWLH